jgi:hypothetical protein
MCERTRPARASFQAKITVIRSWLEKGEIPTTAPVLDTIEQVRRWTNAELNLSTWTSFSVAAPGGKNADLRNQLDELLPLVAKMRAGADRVARAPRTRKPNSQKFAENECRRLATQNEELLAERCSLNADIARLSQLVVEKDRQVGALTATLNKIAPFSKM